MTRKLCKFCGRYLGFSDEFEYVKVNSRSKEGEKKLFWLCCVPCLNEYKLGRAKE